MTPTTTALRASEVLRRCRRWAGAHPSLFLVLAVIAPFLPAFLQFIHRGIPELLFTGDGATLEIRTLHAAHGTQLLGAYSRFKWSHPGPSFFYLALPVYQAFHQRGPALNLFVLLISLGCALGTTFAARALRGDRFAVATACLLAVYEGVASPFQLSSEWNPIVPILPLGLLSMLGVLLGMGRLRPLPLFVFVSALIVQTHIGYVPVVVLISALASIFAAQRWVSRRFFHPTAAAAASATVTAEAEGGSPRPVGKGWPWVLFAAVVLIVLWLPPLLENARHQPGNLTLLYRFFSEPHPPEQLWPAVLETVAVELARMPLALISLLGFSVEPRPPLAIFVGVAQLSALVAMLTISIDRRDRLRVMLALLALGEIAAALVAVRAVRGEVHHYLVAWVSMVGFITVVALTGWAFAAWPRRVSVPPPARAIARLAPALAVLLILVLSVREEARRVDVFRAPEPDAERLARDIEADLRATSGVPPVLRIASGAAWPTAAAVVLHLYKHKVPFAVESEWLFMMGEQFALPSQASGVAAAQSPPQLLIGDGAFWRSARTRRDLRFVASAGEACAFLGDPDYLDKHRLAKPVTLLGATGVDGDPRRAVDGVVPPQGTQWDSPLSVVLRSKDSSVDIAVPEAARADINGIFLSTDGSDTYAVTCLAGDGQGQKLGTVLPGVPIGMGTGLLFDDRLGTCRAIRVTPESGDGYYSVGEVGFLRK